VLQECVSAFKARAQAVLLLQDIHSHSRREHQDNQQEHQQDQELVRDRPGDLDKLEIMYVEKK